MIRLPRSRGRVPDAVLRSGGARICWPVGARMPTPLLKLAVLHLAFWFRPKREATSPVVGQGSLPLTAAKAPLGRGGDGFGAAFARLLGALISCCRRGEKGSGSRAG